MLVDIVVYDGVDEMDVVGPWEVFRCAQSFGAGVDVRLVSREPRDLITGSHGLRFAPTHVFRPGEADVLLVTGGSWVARGESGARAEVQRGDWLPLLASARASGTSIIASVCTGTMLLAHAGIIGSRRAATHHSAREDLAATGATVVNERVVDDGDLVTCGGVTSGLDLALWLVDREIGSEVAELVANRLEYARWRG